MYESEQDEVVHDNRGCKNSSKCVDKNCRWLQRVPSEGIKNYWERKGDEIRGCGTR